MVIVNSVMPTSIHLRPILFFFSFFICRTIQARKYRVFKYFDELVISEIKSWTIISLQCKSTSVVKLSESLVEVRGTYVNWYLLNYYGWIIPPLGSVVWTYYIRGNYSPMHHAYRPITAYSTLPIWQLQLQDNHENKSITVQASWSGVNCGQKQNWRLDMRGDYRYFT